MTPHGTPRAGYTTGEMRECFGRLLNGYSLRVVQDRASCAESTDRFRTLLHRYMMARFVPVLDKMFRDHVRKE